jgi:oligopeptide/dipeptide ABC transporter ATP-binding protein
MTPLLQIEDLKTYFRTDLGEARAVDGLDLQISSGETVALVGESGCGKSVAAFSILGLLPPPGRIVGGRILWEGKDLRALSSAGYRRIRGNEISMVFQEPMTSLNPVFTVGEQIAEVLRLHRGLGRRAAAAGAVEALEGVSIADPGRRAAEYPHQLSGGMRQRVMIAMALCCGPRLLIADEPTTALDVTIQAQILHLIRSVQERRGLAVLLITHDLGIVAQTAGRVAVMYAGRVVEEGPVRRIFSDPLHPYTRGLLKSLPGEPGPGRGPRAGRRLPAIEGTVPDLLHLPPGCAFEPRCADRLPLCRSAPPGVSAAGPERRVRCYLQQQAVVEVEESS